MSAIMNPRARGRGLLARGATVSGRISIFCRKDKNATLHRSAPATWTLPRIAHRSDSISSKLAPGFRREPPRRLSRHLRHTTVKPAAYRNSSVLTSAFKNAAATLSGKIDDIGAALTSAKVDVIVVRKRKFEVPRGRRVSERMWTEFINNGNRRVTFSPVVEAKLVPSKEECYPTPRDKKACFFSKYHKDKQTKRISTGGPDQAEWLLLLFETRQTAAEDREKQEQRGLRTDKKNVVQTGGKQGDGNGGCVAGSSVSEASMVPETESSGLRHFDLLPVGKNKGRGLFKAAKSFPRLVERFYRVSWTPHKGGGADSCFDWVTEFPAGSQGDTV